MKTPHRHNQELVRAAAPSLRYDGCTPFGDWQERAREKLKELLGLPCGSCEDMLEREQTVEQPDFTEIRFTFQSEPGYFVPCHLLIPKGAQKALPTAICLQGHSTGMHISLGRPKYPGDEETIRGGDRDFALRAVSEGLCAVVLEQRCFGECGGTEKGPDCFDSAMTALLIGRTAIGERVWDVSRLIDVLERHFPQVDSKNLILMGNSGGGSTAFYASCIDPRIRYCMPSCAVCTFDASIAAMHHCACNYIPGIRKYFDMGDLAGLVAPRVLVVVAGREDAIFPLSGVEEAFEQIKYLYQSAGALDCCALVIGEGGHRFYADDGWARLNAYRK